MSGKKEGTWTNKFKVEDETYTEMLKREAAEREAFEEKFGEDNTYRDGYRRKPKGYQRSNSGDRF